VRAAAVPHAIVKAQATSIGVNAVRGRIAIASAVAAIAVPVADAFAAEAAIAADTLSLSIEGL
jgi:hypothetical protein